MPPDNAKMVFGVAGICKAYGGRVIFRDVSFKMHAGEFCILAGVNGAGKSTLLRIVAGLAKPSLGEISFNGHPRRAFLGHATFIYPDLDAMDNLRFWLRVAGMQADRQKMLSALERVGLGIYSHEKTRHFSRGMAQRLNFARVLAQNADLILLDEPYTGLDSDARQMMRDEISGMRSRGAAILMVSHDPVSEASFADRLLVLYGGRLAYDGSLPDYDRLKMA